MSEIWLEVPAASLVPCPCPRQHSITSGTSGFLPKAGRGRAVCPGVHVFETQHPGKEDRSSRYLLEPGVWSREASLTPQPLV